MKMMDAVKICFNKYVDFSGRARRSEYWYFVLFNLIVSFVLSLAANMTGGGPYGDGGFNLFQAAASLYSLAALLPGIAVSVRRLHDIGKSGWYYLIYFIPVVGVILLLVWMCRDSDYGDNAYGPSPKM